MGYEYIVTTDSPVTSGRQPARLYRMVGYRARAELAGSGNLTQMQALADRLNDTETKENK